MLLNNLKVNELINHTLVQELSCYERPFIIIRDCIRKNAALYRILFYEVDLSCFGVDLSDFVDEKTEIRFKRINKNNALIVDEINNILLNKQYAAFVINLYYEELWGIEPKAHHLHVVIIKGYDPIKEEYILIDQDYSKEYFKPENANYQLLYCERKVKKEKFIKLCTSISEAPNNNDNEFLYFLAECDKEGQPCSMEDIKKSFIQLIESIKSDLKTYKAVVNEGITEVIENVNATVSNAEHVKYEVMWLKSENQGVHIKLWRLYKREISLKSYKNFFDIYLKNEKEIFYKNTIEKLLDEIIHKYSICKSLNRKALISTRVEPYIKIINHLNDVIEKEEKLYDLFLVNANYLF